MHKIYKVLMMVSLFKTYNLRIKIIVNVKIHNIIDETGSPKKSSALEKSINSDKKYINLDEA